VDWRWSIALLVGAVVVLAATGVACSGDDDSAAPASTTTTRAPPTSRPPIATDRIVVRGNATLDGAPFDAQFVGAVVRRDGLVTPCQATLPGVSDGLYTIAVLAESAGAGCGAPGAGVLLWTYSGSTKLYSTAAARWPDGAASTDFDARFSTATPNGAAPPTTELSGEVFDHDGRRLGAGTTVEAYVGTTRCAVASVRPAGDFLGYILAVVGPDAIEGCERGGTITFRVDGRRANETAVNRLDGGAAASGGAFNLTLP
jgi:hypothetical protein